MTRIRVNVFLVLAALSAVLNVSAVGGECVWNGGGADSNASTAANWVGSVAPTQSTDLVKLDGTSTKNMTWDLTNAVEAWYQETNYTGIVTITTRYVGAFTNMVITGNCTINGGAWTHLTNGIVETNRLFVTVKGNFVLGSNAMINLVQKGYGFNGGSAYGYGPGASTRYTGSSHGGLGGCDTSYTNYPAWTKVYGSITSPTNLGSGAAGCSGGGALYLAVMKTATVDGVVSAVGTNQSNGGCSSGGSLCLVVGELAGTGVLNVAGGAVANYTSCGGGGRIAVILTNSSSFGSVSMRAYGGRSTTRLELNAAAGTVYRQTASQNVGQGTLLIDNNNNAIGSAMTVMTPDAPNLTLLSRIILTNGGWLAMNTNTVLDWVSRTNLLVYGATQSVLTIQNTNFLSLPSPYVLTNLSLYVFANLTFSGDLVVSNASLIFKSVAPMTGLVVAGNARVATNGMISHWMNSEKSRLIMQVNGDLTIDKGGSISADAMGYALTLGPGAGNGSQNNGLPGASHGGQGGMTNGASWATRLTYGSILAPTNCGSGANTYGGGALQLLVRGTTTVNGVLSARAPQTSATPAAAGAGGSVYLVTGSLSGGGTVDVSSVNFAGVAQCGGGGGRIAVYVTNSPSFGSVSMKANGSYTGSAYPGAAGTIYKESTLNAAGAGALIVDNNITAGTVTNATTQLPVATNGVSGELLGVTLWMTNYARVSLTATSTLGNLYLTDDKSKLQLNGNTLTLKSPYHADWGTAARVVYDGGQIVWAAWGSLIIVR